MSKYMTDPFFKGCKLGDEAKTKSRTETFEQMKKRQSITRLKKLRKRGK